MVRTRLSPTLTTGTTKRIQQGIKSHGKVEKSKLYINIKYSEIRDDKIKVRITWDVTIIFTLQ